MQVPARHRRSKGRPVSRLALRPNPRSARHANAASNPESHPGWPYGCSPHSSSPPHLDPSAGSSIGGTRDNRQMGSRIAPTGRNARRKTRGSPRSPAPSRLVEQLVSGSSTGGSESNNDRRRSNRSRSDSEVAERPDQPSRSALSPGRSTQADDVAVADHCHVGGSVPGGTEGRVHLAGVNENCALWRTATRSPNPDRVDSK